MEQEVQEEKVESKEMIPIEKIRELAKVNPSLLSADVNDVFNDNLDLNFKDYVNSDDEEKQEEVKKHNKKKFKLFRKGKEKKETDQLATSIYQSRYDRETWYYKRHKDTIDRYVKKEEKEVKKQQDGGVVIIQTETEEDNTLRIGFLKMWFIVMYDFLFCTILGNLISSPVHLLRYISELFFKMKKAVAITIVIIVGIIVAVLGLILGIDYVFSLAQGLS